MTRWIGSCRPARRDGYCQSGAVTDVEHRSRGLTSAILKGRKVCDQARRRVIAGVFEIMAHDLRPVLQLAEGMPACRVPPILASRSAPIHTQKLLPNRRR
jgi:hypothetical protein